jgi:hypothetical protein
MCRRLCALLWLLTAAVPVTAAPPTPVAYIAVPSTSAGLAAFRHLAPLASKAERVVAYEAFLRLRTGDKGLAGLDEKRPLGAFLLWPMDPRDLFSARAPVVAFVPVQGEKPFVDLLTKLGCQVARAGGDQYRLSIPGQPELVLRFAQGHAYAARSAEFLADPLPDPAAFLPAAAPQRLLMAAVAVGNLPEEAGKRLAEVLQPKLQQVENVLASGQEVPRENLRVLVTTLPMLLSGFLQEVQQLSLTCDLDPAAHQMTVELALVPRTNSALQSLCTYAGTARSRLMHLTEKAGFSLLVHLPPPPASWRESGPGLKLESFVSDLQYAVDARYSDVVARALKVILQTFWMDGLDFCVALQPGPKKELMVLAGQQVHAGRKLDHLLRDAFKDLPATDKVGAQIHWNRARHGRARIHLFGEESQEPGFFGFRDDLVLFAGGNGSLQALKEAFDAHDKVTPAPTPLVQVEVTPPLFREDKEFEEAFARWVPQGERAKVRARLGLWGGKDLRLRLEASTWWIPPHAGK